MAAGKQVVKSTCVGCHKDPEEDGKFVGVFGFDVNRFSYHTLEDYLGKGYTGASQSDLANFIGNEMIDCGGACTDAQNAAAYLWSLRGQAPVVTQYACDTSAPVLYGRRDLKLLTSYEYHNSLQALFKKTLPDDYSTQNRASDDIKVGRMPNHTLEKVSEGRLTAYDANAEELAKWAVATAGALDFDCLDKTTCANNFIDKFAFYAFRRPLTTAERAEYRDIIGTPTDLKMGLQWAIRSVLESPQFLYRSELGKTVAEARSATPEQPSDLDVVQGEPVTTISMPEVTYGSDGFATYGAYKYVGLTPSYNWTGDDIVVVSVKTGGGGNGNFGITVNNDSFKKETVVDGNKVITLRIKGVTGSGKYMQTYNQSGNAIAVSKITVGPAALPTSPTETIPKLDQAESTAYVLDAFEYASALSYMFTGGPPDATLMSAAFKGELGDKTKVASQIDRLLDSELGRKHIGRLAGIWFRTDAVTSVNRTGNDAFTQQVKNSMAQEVRELYKYVFYTPNVPFKAIYTGDFTMLDSVLSSYYGIPGGGNSPMVFAKVDTSNSRRGGVIASGAYMASNAAMNRTSPIFRSVHMRQDMLCQAIALPSNLNDTAARDEAQKKVEALLASGNMTTAEFYNIQTTVPGSSCSTCHDAIINPLFAVDDFDHVGLPRKQSGGQIVQKAFMGDAGEVGKDGVPIALVNQGGRLYSADAVGVLGSYEANQDKRNGGGLAFSGSKDLGQKMVAAGLKGLDTCLFEKTARFSLGHSLNPAFEETGLEKLLTAQQKSHMSCVTNAMETAYTTSNGSARAAMKALGLSDVIRYRK